MVVVEVVVLPHDPHQGGAAIAKVKNGRSKIGPLSPLN